MKDEKARNLKLYQLASLLLLAEGDSFESASIANQINDSDLKLSILLQCLIQAPNRTWAEKERDAETLLQKFPDQSQRISIAMDYFHIRNQY